MESTQQKIESPLMLLKIMWFAFAMTLMLFGFAAYTFIKTANDIAGSEITEKVAWTENALFYPMVLWSLFALILGFSLPQFLIKFLLASRKRQRQVAEKLMVPDRLAIAANSNQQLNDQAVESIFAFILRMSLFESIALCGFVLAFITHQFEPYICFASLAALLFFTSYPSAENFNSKVRVSVNSRNRQQ